MQATLKQTRRTTFIRNTPYNDMKDSFCLQNSKPHRVRFRTRQSVDFVLPTDKDHRLEASAVKEMITSARKK